MSKAEMILYSPASYFFVHNCGTNHQRTNFFMGYLWFFSVFFAAQLDETPF